MSFIQKILLILSGVFFCLTLFGGMQFGVYVAITFFMLHSVCLILFAYRVFKDGKDQYTVADTYKQEIGQELASKDREIEELKVQIREKEDGVIDISREKETLVLENEELKKNLEEVTSEKEGLLKETEEMKAKESDRKISEGLLPPVENEDFVSSVDIIALAREAVDELSESARQASLKINVQSSLDSLMVKADRKRLIVLFRNIIDNSIKYMNKAGSLVITVSTIGDDIFIVLKDTGEGLNEDETKHIFELNYQGSNRLSGNGLGLTQAKAIVEYYGGTIYAKSTEGKGMGIYIQLPA